MVIYFFRVVVGLIGLLMLYAGIFLTETEEGQLQNLLEELWVRVDDLRSAAMSWQAALLQQVSGLTEHGMVMLFGQKLFSVKSFASCLCLAISSIFLSFALLPEDPAFPRTVTLICSAIFLLFALSQTLRYLGFVLPGVGAILGLLRLGGVFRANQLSLEDVVASSLGYLLGVFSLIGSIVLTRWSLRVASRMRNAASLVVIIVANVLLAVILLSPLLIAFLVIRFSAHVPRIVLKLSSNLPGFIFSTSATTLFAAALALVVVLVLLAAFVHRVIWPVMSRAVYAVHRHGLVQPKLLRAIGCACLVLACPNNILVKAIAKGLHWVS